MEPLITRQQFAKAIGIDKVPLLDRILMQFSGLNDLNTLYSKIQHRQGIAFIDALLETQGVRYEIYPEELARIPKTGPFVLVSNHPFGGIDGLMLLKMVSEVRPDFVVMANFLLTYIKPISHLFVPVNPLEGHREVASSVTGMKFALKHLQEGHALGLFPAGEVSTFYKGQKGICDREWQKPALKLIQKSGVPVLPVYFKGANSWSFHALGKAHPSLRTLRLPAELANRKKQAIRIRIGNPVPVRDIQSFDDIQHLGRYLRAKVYSMGPAIEQKKLSLAQIKLPVKHKPVIGSTDKEVLIAELAGIKSRRINTQQQFELYLAPSTEIPNVLREIGRLREITFREEGEGTNKEIDLDDFDQYYLHLFLWDTETAQIAGAYRVGMGKDIIQKHGRKGFYTNSLFRMKDAFVPILEKSIELGRSFIVPEYQNKRLPLFMLWRGILSVLLSNPDYKFIIGPVSISNAYSTVSKSLIVAFIRQHYFDYELARWVKPKRKYSLDVKTLDAAALLENSKNDMKKLDRIIDDIEPAIKSAPVLLKKYIQQNAKIIGFNIDPDFSDALDGLMILNIDHVNQETIENLKKEFNTTV
jgi:putative hemolysin